MINTASFALFFLLFTKYSGAIFITSGDYEDKALNNTFFNPQYYDVMLTDLDYAKISDISLVDLRFEHNSLTSSRPTFPISGIVAVAPSYGRTVGGVILKYKKKSIQSFVVFDSGAPTVYLCDRTFLALGINHADHANVIVHGHPTGVLRSTGHFREVNVIGATYFLENKLQFNINYRSRKVSIDIAPTLTEEQEDEL
eukprot:gene41531-56184_t